MRKQTTQYLSNLATTLIQQLHIPESIGEKPHGLQDLYDEFSDAIKAKLIVMNPGTRGQIADFGLAYGGSKESAGIPMYHVHCNSFLGKYESGRNLVTEIACTTIVAKIYEMLRNKSLPGHE
jgi:hypothetical protein